MSATVLVTASFSTPRTHLFAPAPALTRLFEAQTRARCRWLACSSLRKPRDCHFESVPEPAFMTAQYPAIARSFRPSPRILPSSPTRCPITGYAYPFPSFLGAFADSRISPYSSSTFLYVCFPCIVQRKIAASTPIIIPSTPTTTPAIPT